jgi:sensor histidine kinase YesM
VSVFCHTALSHFCNIVFLATTKYVCKLFKLTEMVMILDDEHIGHSSGCLLCHKMNTSVFVLSWQNTDTSSFITISVSLKSLQTYLVVARNTILQKWLRAVVYCLIYLLTHWFLLNLIDRQILRGFSCNKCWSIVVDETLIKGRHILRFSEEEYIIKR